MCVVIFCSFICKHQLVKINNNASYTVPEGCPQNFIMLYNYSLAKHQEKVEFLKPHLTSLSLLSQVFFKQNLKLGQSFEPSWTLLAILEWSLRHTSGLLKLTWPEVFKDKLLNDSRRVQVVQVHPSTLLKRYYYYFNSVLECTCTTWTLLESLSNLSLKTSGQVSLSSPEVCLKLHSSVPSSVQEGSRSQPSLRFHLKNTWLSKLKQV